jgi:hypothetical protein
VPAPSGSGSGSGGSGNLGLGILGMRDGKRTHQASANGDLLGYLFGS